jgi:copper chaperone
LFACASDRIFIKQKEMSEVEFEYRVGMTCDGCKGAVTRILSKIPEIDSFDADVDAKRVIVRPKPNTQLDPQFVLEKLAKWASASGKDLEFVGVRSTS